MAQHHLCHEDYTVGWVCALPIELAAAAELLDEEHQDLPQDPGDANIYTLGRIAEHNVVVACLPAGQTGNNSAAAVAAQMKSKFTSIRFGLMVGIGGGVPNDEADIRLGDVVVSQPHNDHGGVVQYDFGRTTPSGFRRTGSLNTPPTILLNALSKLRANHFRGRNNLSAYLSTLNRLPKFAHHNAGPDILHEPSYNHAGGLTCERCSRDRLVERISRGSQEIVVHYGTIASGNQVIRDGITRDRLSSELGGIICFEMEAAGLMNSFPCLIIRGICDYADSHKNKNWQPYAAATAAAFAKEILSVIPRAEVAITRTVDKAITDNNDQIIPRPSISILPFKRDVSFVGREDIISEIDRRLTLRRRVAIAGIGGVGKSQIAIEYCYRFRAKTPHSSILWVHAGTPARFQEAYTAIGRKLSLPGLDYPKADILQAVHDWLSNERHGAWLMVLDDVDDMETFFATTPELSSVISKPMSSLAAYIPRSPNGSILVTTRDTRVGERLSDRDKCIMVSQLAKQDAEHLLRSKVSSNHDWSESDAAGLVKTLEYLPSAITQAAAFISENHCTVADYLETLQASDSDEIDMLNENSPDPRRDIDRPGSAIATYTTKLPKGLNKYFEVPLDANKNYVERVNITSLLEELLVDGDNSSLATSRRVVLHGLGGAGKTEIALRFAERHRKDYIAVFWVNGVDQTHMENGFHLIARTIGIDDPTSIQMSVLNTLSWLSTHYKWLLIVDNLDEDDAMNTLQRKYLSAAMNGNILITSRNPNAATRWIPVEVTDMEQHEAKTLLANIAGSSVSKDLDVVGLLEDLGHLPLAIDQAASFIFETGISVTQYRKLYERKKRTLLECYPSTQYNHESRHSVMTTWELCFTRVEDDNPPASKLLLMFSLLHHDEIPFQALESSLEGQRHWAPNGEFEELPVQERWIPEDLLCIFSDQFRLLQALAALRRFSLVRYQASRQMDSRVIRVHPLVHYWASERLKTHPALKTELMKCTIGLVAGCFAQQDRLPPLTTRRISAYVLEEKTVAVWPWREYRHLAPHALHCLQYSRTLDHMPESVAHLALSLLQVMEYSTFGTFTDDQAFALVLIDHVQAFQTASDRYLEFVCMAWRLRFGERCACRKYPRLCESCSLVRSHAEQLLGSSADTPRARAAKRSVELISSLPPFANPYANQIITGTLSVRSLPWIEMYQGAFEEYLYIRSVSEDRYAFNISFESALKVAETFQLLCGVSSEEYRRSLFYATGPLMDSAQWQKVEDLLRPLIDWSIKHPVHSWSHERCIIRFAEALFQQGKEEAARETLSNVKEAYRVTGRQLRTIESQKLLEGMVDTIPPKQEIQIFVKLLTGRTMTIATHTHATVRSFWGQLYKREGTLPEQGWRLIYAGKQLEPERFLSDYNIQREATLHLVLRLSGGRFAGILSLMRS